MELEPSGTAVKLSITHTIEREPSSLLESGSIVLQEPYPVGNQG
jgi:hypothetical protein